MSRIEVLAIMYRDGTEEKNCGKCRLQENGICLLWQETETAPDKWCAYGIIGKTDIKEPVYALQQ